MNREAAYLKKAVLKLKELRGKLRDEKKRHAETAAELARIQDPTLADLRFKDGTLDVSLTGPIIHRLAAIWCTTLIEAPNYNEIKAEMASGVLGGHQEFTVTVQRRDGKTPHELRREAEEKLAKMIVYVEQIEHQLKTAEKGYIGRAPRMYRDDYAQGGLQMLSVEDQEGDMVGRLGRTADEAYEKGYADGREEASRNALAAEDADRQKERDRGNTNSL